MRLALRLGYSPFLRLLVFNVWFRSAVIVLVFTALLLGLAIPKIWTVTPEGVYPVCKVRLLDLIRSRTLRHAAERAVAAGQPDAALPSWRGAATYNPGEADLLRGFLRSALAAKVTPELAQETLQVSRQLFHLARTNQADVELVVSGYERFQLDHATVELLAPEENELAPALEAAYLKAIFNQGELARFRTRWKVAEARLPKQPELDLYRAAAVLSSGAKEQVDAAKAQLIAASTAGPHQVTANRLLLLTGRQAGDVGGCVAVLGRLISAKQDTLRDHLTCWQALVEKGREAEARQLMQTYPKAPQTIADTLDLTDLCDRVGMHKRALELLNWTVATYGYSSTVCARYSASLIGARDWAGLRSLALKLRGQPGLPNSLQAFSYYMEGQAELGEGHREAAEVAFDRISTVDTENPDLGLALASGLLEIGLSIQALAALTRLEDQLQYRADYWNVLARLATAQTNTVLLLRATQKAFELQPHDPLAKNNYATSLLLERANPTEALRLASAALAEMPTNLLAQLNHAAALAQNDRAPEARELLDRLDPARLSPAQRSQYYLAQFEAACRLNRSQEAWKFRESIRVEHLYPPQIRWLEEKTRALPPRSLAAPPSS
jgi:thioredoxin-like negative regulator of GroEL